MSFIHSLDIRHSSRDHLRTVRSDFGYGSYAFCCQHPLHYRNLCRHCSRCEQSKTISITTIQLFRYPTIVFKICVVESVHVCWDIHTMGWICLVAHHYCITHTKCIPHILCLCGASRICATVHCALRHCAV